MSRAVLLDPRTGQPETKELLAASGLPLSVQSNLDNGWTAGRSPGLYAPEIDAALGRPPGVEIGLD